MNNIEKLITTINNRTDEEKTIIMMKIIKQDIYNIIESNRKEGKVRTDELVSNINGLFNHLLLSMEHKEDFIKEVEEMYEDYDIDNEYMRENDQHKEHIPFGSFDDDIDFDDDDDEDDDDDDDDDFDIPF